MVVARECVLVGDKRVDEGRSLERRVIACGSFVIGLCSAGHVSAVNGTPLIGQERVPLLQAVHIVHIIRIVIIDRKVLLTRLSRRIRSCLSCPGTVMRSSIATWCDNDCAYWLADFLDHTLFVLHLLHAGFLEG